MVFILFFLILFLLSGGYWLLNSTKNKTQQEYHPLSNLLEKNKPVLPADKQANNQDSFSSHSIVSSGRLPKTTDTFQAVTPKTKTSPIIIKKAGKSVANKTQKDLSLKMSSVTEDKIIASSQNKEFEREKNVNNEKDHELSDENNQRRKDTEIAEVKIENILGQDIDAQNKGDVDTLLKKVERKLNAKKPSKDFQKSKWILGVRFSGGMSFLSNELLDINNNNGDYLSTPNDPSSGIGNSGSGSPSRLSVKRINSTAFIGGVFVEKDISKKSKIALGINYKYFSIINKTGSKIDSAQTAYNSTTYTNTYRNHFNYLELPVSLKFHLTNNSSLPVYWLAGINISQLISSNALQFKSNTGVYYNDNSLFNKTQWGFSTGFFATLFSQKKVHVNIGPYFYYNAFRMANEGLYDKKHFNFIGISAEILFNKK
jgi:hypothetical protein